MSILLQDLRLALRSFRREPGFFFVALLTLALGIGASSAIFTAVNAVVLRPLPYEEPENLVMVLEQNLQRGWKWYSVSPANFLDWRKQVEVFEDIAAYSLYSDTGYNLTGGSEPERVVSSAVSASFFEVFRAQALRGRTFLPTEDEPGQDRVVVISHGLWQRRFGADPNMVGRQVKLDGTSHEVVGVMSPGFAYPEGTELWLPLAFDAKEKANRTVRSLFVVGRLAEGTSVTAAQTHLDTVASRLEQAYPESNSGFGVVVHRLHDRVVGNVRSAMLVLLGAVGFLLLIACANVANLVLVRASGRQKEFALRQALGASRRRMAGQLFAESLLLAVCGGLLGLLLAILGNRLLVTAAPANLPRLGEISLDGRVLLFTASVALLTSVAFSLAPVASLSRLSLNSVLGTGSRGASSNRDRARLRQVIVVAQVAFALLLLVGAGLTARSFFQLQRQDIGFRPEGLLSMQLALPAVKYSTGDAQGLFFSELLARVEALPGVTSAAVTSWLPFASVPVDWDFHIEGRPPETLDDAVTAGFRAVSAGYFETLGDPLRVGRTLVSSDRADSPGVVVINETMARRFWPDGDPLGQRLVMGELVKGIFPNLPLTMEVVGVVGDVKQSALDLPPEPEMFVPFSQYAWSNMFLLVRSAADPRALDASVRSQIKEMDPAQPIYDAKTIEDRVQASLTTPRLTLLLLGVFAVLALVLASVGIYGVISYSMGLRTREIGTRLALGAARGDILRWVLGRGLAPAVAGLVVGLLTAPLLTRWLRSLLFEVSPNDPLTLALVTVALGLVSFGAALIPALRTARLDPLEALRQE
ncbi:MAG: ABC transporter permease [Deltaproteobacteria bacterium]|nr:ABC transporter permease [Deltaproteobacteria bacterium]